MKVTAILKGREDKDKRITIQIRVNIGRKRYFYPLKIKVRKNQFQKGKVYNHPNASIFNSVIKREIQNRELNQVIGKQLDPEFFAYAEKCLTYWREAKIKKPGTLRHYRSVLNKLQRFRSTFRISEMNTDFFARYLTYLYSCGNVENTAWANFSKIHAILAQAIDDEILSKNPLDKFKDTPQYKDPPRDFLTPEQVKKIELFAEHGASKEQQTSSYWFLIGVYTGMRFSDMKTFDKKKHIIGGRLIKENIKTGELISLPVRDKIKYLFEKVKYKPFKITNEAYNRMLKVIAEKCGIDINFTAHLSRHTSAMLLANSGASIEETAAILGHTSTKHTEIYYKISNQRIDKAIDKIIKG